MSTFSAPKFAAARLAPQPSQPDPTPSNGEVATVDTPLTANTPKDPTPSADEVNTQQNSKPSKAPITKFDVFSVPHLPKKPAQPDVRKPAGPKLPRLRNLVPSVTGPSCKPKPTADTAAATDAKPSDPPNSAGEGAK